MKSKKRKKKEVAAAPVPAPTATPVEIINGPFPPHLLEHIAEEEPERRALSEYHRVIRILREEKKFTFREIAEFLSEHNVAADHNAVYREYTKAMDERDAVQEEMADDEMERNDAGLP